MQLDVEGAFLYSFPPPYLRISLKIPNIPGVHGAHGSKLGLSKSINGPIQAPKRFYKYCLSILWLLDFRICDQLNPSLFVYVTEYGFTFWPMWMTFYCLERVT